MAPTRKQASSLLFSAVVSSHAASIRPDGAVQIFSLTTGTCVAKSKLNFVGRPTSIALQFPRKVAVGTSNGEVIVEENNVTTLAGGPAIVACGEGVVVAGGGAKREVVVIRDAVVVNRFDFGKDHCVEIGALCLSSDARFAIVCSQAITQIDLSSGRVVRRYSGHERVKSVCLDSDSKRFYTAGGDRFVNVWEIGGEGSVKRRKKGGVWGPKKSYSAKGDVSSVIVGENGVIGGVMKGGVMIWDGDRDAVVKVDALCVGILKGNLECLYAEGLKIRSERVELDQIEGEIGIATEKKTEKEGEEVKVRMVKEAASLEGSRIVAVAGEEEEANGVMSGEESEEEVEPSIADKLKLMGVAVEERVQAPKSGGIVTGSRANVLVQAVRSGDGALFDRSIEQTKGAKETVQRMPAQIATGKFLDMLVERMERTQVIPWIKEVLIEHAGVFLGKRERLGGMIRSVEERVEGVEEMAKLEGRLELIVGRFGRAGAKAVDDRPAAEYVEENGSGEGEGEDDSESESDSESGSGSESESDSEEGEGETGDFSESEERSEDEEMKDMGGETKMNGRSEDEEDSLDEGD